MFLAQDLDDLDHRILPPSSAVEIGAVQTGSLAGA
jgi:hypothetical protein